MAQHIERKNFDRPDETRTFERGKVDVVKLDHGTIGRGIFEPGWRWSECVKPIVQTKSCEVAHFGYVVSGHMKIRMDDGTETEFGPGDAMDVAPGHDAWIVGKEACVLVDVTGAEHYAERRT